MKLFLFCLVIVILTIFVGIPLFFIWLLNENLTWDKFKKMLSLFKDY